MRQLLLVLLFIPISICCYGQLTIDSSSTSYSLNLKEGDFERTLNFRKHKDSVRFTHFQYEVTPSGKTSLSTETKYIKRLWDIAKDSIEVYVKSVNIGHPLEYNDVLAEQIKAFNKSAKWQQHVKRNGKKVQYTISIDAMLKGNVYSSLDSLLKSEGYQISNFSNEKFSFLEKDKLIKNGFSGKEIVPIPNMVVITVRRTNKNK